MKPKFSFEKSVGGVIFFQEENTIKYLLLHYESGHWDFPKGHVEKGESDGETLKREIQEETGITGVGIIPGFKKQIRYFYRAGKEEKEKRIKEGIGTSIIKRVIYYLAETKTKEVKISFEHIGFEWLAYDNALERITYKNSKEVLKEANDFLINNKQLSIL
ncbi:MAG: NUDIX domain-containing protein [Candidatus Moranbacteria bacterium]|nr:NUDIX domain-containing protein [Candidatus Moranbacteria bacterium]